MRSVGLYTLGCKVSQYETEAIAERFVSRGFSVLPFTEVCDAYVVNTCTVTAESDRKSRQVIRRAIAKNPDAVVAVIGCYTQRAPMEVAGIEGVDVVLGTQDKLAVVDRVIERLDGESGQHVSAPSLDGAEFEPMCITRAPRTRAYVKIEDGCEAKCTYCAISGARGRVRSKPREAVISEVSPESSILYTLPVRGVFSFMVKMDCFILYSFITGQRIALCPIYQVILQRQESMVEMVRVVSSRTSRRTLTVSRDVNIVTLFSVAYFLISKPSRIGPEDEGSLVLIT